MDCPVKLPMAPKNLPSVYGHEPLPFLEGEVNLDQEFVRGYPLNGYGYFAIPALDTHTHPSKLVEERSADLADFQGKGIPRPEFHLTKCVHLKDNMDIGPEGVRSETPINTLLHSMIGENPSGRFIARVDFRHYASVSIDNRFTFWLCDCLHRFKARLKAAEVYDAIWVSRHKKQLD